MMELDELKNAWTALDDRLKKNEMLESRIIREMKQNKANKSLNRLICFEVFSLIILLVSLPIIIYVFNDFPEKLFIVQILKIYLIVFTLVSIIWYSYKLYGLMKINLLNKISNNIYHINNYTIQIKREKIWIIICSVPMALLAILCYAQLKVPFNLWIFMSCIFLITIVLCIWIYKKLYDSNIQSIKNSLEELKELEEE